MYDAFQSILNDLFLRECNLHVQYVFLVKKDVISGTFLLVKIYKEWVNERIKDEIFGWKDLEF